MGIAEKFGLNRTGIGMTPIQSKEMLEGAAQGPLSPGEDGHGLLAVRQVYTTAAEAIGTVPLPSTLKGVAHTAVDLFKGQQPAVLIDKLGERLAFERTGSRLYEAMIGKLEIVGAAALWAGGPTLPELQAFHDDELAHFALVRRALDRLGADPTAMTPSADLAGVESQGLLQVIGDPRTDLGQDLHALLTAELVDNAGWELLIPLVRDAGQDELAAEFMNAQRTEEQHLRAVRAWLASFVQRAARGELQASA